MQTDAECLKALTEVIKQVHEKEIVPGCCDKDKDYEVKQSFLDFRPLKL